MSSYRKIDYRLRPAKHVERALFVEALKLTPFSPVNEYQYVGMGSLYFSDFRLFHKSLGLSKMISIESNLQDKERFEFNKPFSCLEIRYGFTWNELPKINLEEKNIIWLDYDGPLTKDVLSDIKLVSTKCASGNFFAFSVNTNSLRNQAKSCPNQNSLELLEEAVGKNKVPPNTKADDLSDKGTAIAYFEIMKDEINSALAIRNQGLNEKDIIDFKQIFHIRYSDGAAMLTIGGFFVSKSDNRKFNTAKYSKQPYTKTELEEALVINIPMMTMVEQLALDKIVPIENFEEIDFEDIEHQTNVPKKDIINYLKNYRFLPNFISVDLH